MAGDLNGAIAAFQRAARLQAALVYDEPEPLPFSAFQRLGAALIESKRFDEAEKAYRTELEDHPHNGWSLLGLQQALAGRGVPSGDVDGDLASSRSRSDTWIRSSRF
jgi:tetratricopeptide (TPR) repeat protein